MSKVLCIALFATATATVMGQPSVTVNFAGASIPSSGTNPPDLVRNSTGTIDTAPGYLFSFNPIVRGTGLLGFALIPTDRPLGDVLNGFVPGQQRILHGAVRNPEGTVPVRLDREIVAGVFSGISISLTFDQEILGDRRGSAGIRNITKPSGLGINVVSGGAVYTTWTPPIPVVSEFHFDGDLQSVKQSGLAPNSGPARVRYLDDSAFGPILGGPGALTSYPNPPTPQNITIQQSSFGTTTSFGIPGIGGVEDTVYRTSPPRNAMDPTNQAKSRGIGLAMWPNSRDFWPEDRNGQWTLIWDILIPPGAASGEFIAPLIEGNHNNEAMADAFLRFEGGQIKFGYETAYTNYVALLVSVNQWFRLAISSDGYRTNESRVFVNGAFVGTTGVGWLYSSTKSTDPRYGDVSSTNLLGTAVPAATWNSWGQFPSPWAQAPNSTMAPMASTVCLFSDLMGRGESIYIANMLYTDEAMTDSQVASLGGPNARGIVYLRPVPCVADVDDGSQTGTPDGGVTIEDLLYYLIMFDAGDGRADVDDGSGTGTQDGGVTIEDLLYYLFRFDAGC